MLSRYLTVIVSTTFVQILVIILSLLFAEMHSLFENILNDL